MSRAANDSLPRSVPGIVCSLLCGLILLSGSAHRLEATQAGGVSALGPDCPSPDLAVPRAPERTPAPAVVATAFRTPAVAPPPTRRPAALLPTGSAATVSSSRPPTTEATTKAPDWPLVLWDDFSDPDSGWFTGSVDAPDMAFYRDEALQIAFDDEANRRRSSVSIHQFSDFRLDTDVWSAGADDNFSCGLFLRYRRPQYHYDLQIRSDGTFQVGLRDGAEDVVLQPLTHSPCLLTGPQAVNHLTAIAVGPRLEFYANACPMTVITDTRLAEGDVGVWAATDARPGAVDVRFDNVRVYSPQSYPPVSFEPMVFSPVAMGDLEARGELLDVFPYPAEPVSHFPAGVRLFHSYARFEGLTPRRTFRQTILIDGQEVWTENPKPWSQWVRDFEQLGFGTFGMDYKMRLGGPLPSGHFEVRWYVDDVPAVRGFVSVGVASSPPTPEPLEISTVAPLAPPKLLPASQALGQAAQLCARRRWTDALNLYQQAIAAAPDATQPLLDAAQCYQKAGRSEWAASLSTTARNLTQSPTADASTRPPLVVLTGTPAPAPSREPAAQATTLPSDECFQNALTAYNRKEYRSAAALFKLCLSAVPKASQAAVYEYLGRSCYFDAVNRKDENRFDAAIDALKKGVALQPGNAHFYDYLGRIEYYRKNRDQALSYLAKATELDAALTDPYYFRGVTLFDRGQYEQAFSLLNQYLALGGTALEARAYGYIGWVHLLSKERDAAEEALLKSLSLPDPDYNTYGGLARLYGETGRCAAAIPMYEKALELRPDWQPWRTGLAYCQSQVQPSGRRAPTLSPATRTPQAGPPPLVAPTRRSGSGSGLVVPTATAGP